MYTVEDQRRVKAARRSFNSWHRSGIALLKAADSARPSPGRSEGSSEADVSPAMANARASKVAEDSTAVLVRIRSMDEVIEDLSVVPDDERAYVTYVDKAKDMFSQVVQLKADAKVVTDDAFVCGLQDQYVEISTALRRLEDGNMRVRTAYNDAKSAFGSAAAAKEYLSTPPNFSGDIKETEFYSSTKSGRNIESKNTFLTPFAPHSSF